MDKVNSGHQEVEHTADSAIRVWAPDLPGLFMEAAKGMQAIAGMRLDNQKRKWQSISLIAQELESLLVMFLEEVLFLSESTGLGFDRYAIEINQGFNMNARLGGTKICEKGKEIKAVTFHNMSITETDSGYEVVIVFDV